MSEEKAWRSYGGRRLARYAPPGGRPETAEDEPCHYQNVTCRFPVEMSGGGINVFREGSAHALCPRALKITKLTKNTATPCPPKNELEGDHANPFARALIPVLRSRVDEKRQEGHILIHSPLRPASSRFCGRRFACAHGAGGEAADVAHGEGGHVPPPTNVLHGEETLRLRTKKSS